MDRDSKFKDTGLISILDHAHIAIAVSEFLREHKTTLPISGTNDSGETVIISAGSSDGEEFYRLDTYQHNGWIRVNNYYEDGTVDETYER